MISYRMMDGPALEALGQRNAAPVQAIPAPFGLWSSACMGRGGQIGLAHGWHVLAAGPTGMGKTYLAANVGAAALDFGASVAFHSLEMDWDELATRVAAIVSGEPAYRLNSGKHFSWVDFRSASRAVLAARGRMVMNDEPMYKLSDLLDGIHRTHEQFGCRLHIVDYLQLAWTNHESQRDQITEVSHRVRQTAKELGVVTFCLSQLNRNASGVDERPRKESMIGGSALENDADQVLLLDHSRKTKVNDATGRETGWIGWLLLDKNRHGPALDIPIRFSAATGRMEERRDDEIHDFEIPEKRVVRG